ncbi:hypothetical protein GDO81_011620 [Engystomops pustulosus]|uniref:Uncharacterized protein n=1 Tax=Engystomops pustulosus TaxID=76066 RepID=A0AAV7BFK0_ENGPU|nr:hypothetical protein GDO81_011620 [Engystomops pustulosus]
MKASNILLITLICLSFISYIVTVVFNALSAVSQSGLFITTASNISGKYPLDVTPAGWTFSIWSVIYIWNGLWIIYVVSTLFRRNKSGPVYLQPEVHPPEFFALWIVNNLINIGWLFLWDRELLIFANIFLALIPITIFLMLHMSYRNCYRHANWMSQNQRFDLWCIRILVHNGLATYATWTSIATIVNFGLVLKYNVSHVMEPYVSSVVLGLIMFALLFWFLMESCMFEKYVRYTFTIYPVAIVASVGIFLGVDEDPEEFSDNEMMNAVIIAVSSAFCVIRFILLFSCDKLRPMISEEKTNHSEVASPTSLHTNGHLNPMTIEMEEP